MLPIIVILMEKYSYYYYKNIIYCYLLTLENPSSNIVLLKSLFAPPSVFISSSKVKKLKQINKKSIVMNASLLSSLGAKKSTY